MSCFVYWDCSRSKVKPTAVVRSAPTKIQMTTGPPVLPGPAWAAKMSCLIRAPYMLALPIAAGCFHTYLFYICLLFSTFWGITIYPDSTVSIYLYNTTSGLSASNHLGSECVCPPGRFWFRPSPTSRSALCKPCLPGLECPGGFDKAKNTHQAEGCSKESTVATPPKGVFLILFGGS